MRLTQFRLSRGSEVLLILIVTPTMDKTFGADLDLFTGFRCPKRPPWQFGIKSPYNNGEYAESMPTRFTVPNTSLDEESGALNISAIEDELRRNFRPPRFIIPEACHAYMHQ
jgi:hypothetical protein